MPWRKSTQDLVPPSLGVALHLQSVAWLGAAPLLLFLATGPADLVLTVPTLKPKWLSFHTPIEEGGCKTVNSGTLKTWASVSLIVAATAL